MDTNCNAILFIDTPTMPGRTMPIGQLRSHVSRSFLVMFRSMWNFYRPRTKCDGRMFSQLSVRSQGVYPNSGPISFPGVPQERSTPFPPGKVIPRAVHTLRFHTGGLPCFTRIKNHYEILCEVYI